MRIWVYGLALAGMALLGGCAAARPAAVVVIDAGRLFDGQRTIDDGRVIIDGDRIVAVGPRAALAAPAGARIVDHGDRFVMPGLIAAHSHVGTVLGTEHGGRFYSRDTVLRDLRQFQRYGVVAVNALGLNRPAFHGFRREMRGPAHDGADLYGAGAGIGTVGGVPPEDAMGVVEDQVVRPTTPDAARSAVRAMAARGIDMVKLWLDPQGGDAPRMAPEIYNAVIDEGHRLGLPVAAHIHDLEDARALVEAGVDVIAHGVRDRPVDAAFVTLMRDRGVWYIPTINIDEAEYLYARNPGWLADPFVRAGLSDALAAQIADPAWRADALERAGDSERAVATNIANLRRLNAAGVRIALGTDSGGTALRVPGLAEHRELELMVSAGLTPEQALATATAGAADALRTPTRGRLAAGQTADLLVLDGDPTSDIRQTRRIREIWRSGRLTETVPAGRAAR